ncbi:type I restriction-modification enzyme R subunit C-terminal domain-containing protein, partial [Streptomyces olivaceoviridis]
RDNWKRWFPGRADLPKTLIFAGPYDDHADEVLKQVKQVFGRGDEFAKKITYRSRDNGDDPEALINDLRNSSRLRVAVTVDMIATGTDVKPLECVIFLRPVKSPVMFEQMKGRGARSIDADELKAVTPEAAPDLKKDRFVLIDAVGVTDSPLVDARPLIPAGAERGVSLAKLLDKAGTRSLTADEAETLARRLARIDRQLGDEERTLLARTSGGVSLADLARRITDAVDVDTQDRARHEGGPELAQKLVQDAVAPLTVRPELRKLILEIRHQQDLTYDETTEVKVTELREIPREERARKELAEWNSLLEKEQRDENAAIRVALGSGAKVPPREARAALKELAGRIRATNRSWTTGVLWDHYEQLGKAAAGPGKEAGLGDLMRIIRFELGADDELRPYRTVVEERFEGWLLRQRQAGVEFTEDQLWWLERIKNAIAADVGMEPGDFSVAPFSERGGGRGFMRAFGDKDRALELLDELNQELA